MMMMIVGVDSVDRFTVNTYEFLAVQEISIQCRWISFKISPELAFRLKNKNVKCKYACLFIFIHFVLIFIRFARILRPKITHFNQFPRPSIFNLFITSTRWKLLNKDTVQREKMSFEKH